MSLDRPDPPPTVRRRPFDELIAELAEKTGRPLWKVTRCQSSVAARQIYEKAPSPKDIEEDVLKMWRTRLDLSAEQIASHFDVSMGTVYKLVKGVRRHGRVA